jgi:DNA-binding NtrC family response regulator
MSSARIQIIAPDADLRHSLEFALQAAGYFVSSVPSVEAAIGPEPFDCYVMDHQAARTHTAEVASFCRRAQPLIVLAGRPSAWLSQLAFRTVQKPLLGEALLTAVHDALSTNPLPAA